MYSGNRLRYLLINSFICLHLTAYMSFAAESSLDEIPVQLTNLTRTASLYDKGDRFTISAKHWLKNATIHDPTLLAPFRKYALYTKWTNQDDLIILVCDSMSKKGLFEDISCTGADIDEVLWKQSISCQFSLSAAKINQICEH